MNQSTSMSVRSYDQLSVASHRTGDNVNFQDPALRGASIAFRASPPPAKPLVNTYSGTNGALAAATRAGLGGPRLPEGRRTAHASYITDSGPQQSLKAGRDAMIRRTSAGLPHGEDVASPQARQQESPSYLAATRAAARATPAPMSRDNTGAKLEARGGNNYTKSPSPNDESPIPATNKLVELFEAKQRSPNGRTQAKVTAAPRIVSPMPIRPPASILHSRSPAEPSSPTYPTKPATISKRNAPGNRNEVSSSGAAISAARSASPIKKPPQRTEVVKKPPAKPPVKRTPTQPVIPPKKPIVMEAVQNKKGTSSKTPKAPVAEPLRRRESELTTSHQSTTSQQSQKQPITSQKTNKPPTPPPPRRDKNSEAQSPSLLSSPRLAALDTADSDSSEASFASARERFSRTNTLSRSGTYSGKNTASKPNTPSGKSTLSRTNPISSNNPLINKPSLPPKPLTLQTTSSTTFVDPSPTTAPLIPPRRSSTTVTQTSPSLHTLKPQLTADSLANAMVASSLASSRAPSPSKPRPAPPPPPRRRSSKNLSLNFLMPSPPTSRAASPLKSMRQTLRKAPQSPDEDDREHRHMLKRKHPNKHAEGDRKRWRDSITEKERKRYEGVWAANRGAVVPVEGTGPEDVHGLVVKDIWGRSKLGRAILEQVWDLVVDFGMRGSERGVLRKEEFVVGLWLVDQCLKGKKLPVEIGETVWSSVRRLPAGMRAR